MLKAQAQDLPKQEAFLAQIRRQVPSNPALPALIRDLTAGAKKSGVELLSLAPALPVAVVAPAVTAVVPTTAGTAAPSPTTTTAPGTVTTPAAAAPVLYQVPITVKTSGSYFETEQFLNKVEALKRSFLVTGFTLKYSASTADEPDRGSPGAGDQGSRVPLACRRSCGRGNGPGSRRHRHPRPVDGPRGQLTRRLT